MSRYFKTVMTVSSGFTNIFTQQFVEYSKKVNNYYIKYWHFCIIRI